MHNPGGRWWSCIPESPRRKNRCSKSPSPNGGLGIRRLGQCPKKPLKEEWLKPTLCGSMRWLRLMEVHGAKKSKMSASGSLADQWHGHEEVFRIETCGPTASLGAGIQTRRPLTSLQRTAGEKRLCWGIRTGNESDIERVLSGPDPSAAPRHHHRGLPFLARREDGVSRGL
jgi:hypothetical protein